MTLKEFLEMTVTDAQRDVTWETVEPGRTEQPPVVEITAVGIGHPMDFEVKRITLHMDSLEVQAEAQSRAAAER